MQTLPARTQAIEIGSRFPKYFQHKHGAVAPRALIAATLHAAAVRWAEEPLA